ncbi:Z-ring formation inhibitor MciZ [Alkalihalobacillus alcalophilus]|uniref:Z-ring formation inhibitor MciZ n=1 Tax=Alkalihalobacillus alcalophilus TaxID=1445 RepID=UPI0009DDA1A4|nr:Z-ring formation inhibitor MciZ [Alkalihalobacillus alcalophilus]MED1564120.1 Z-ring formation inhibitor MciZ [Alkalihalobacillus alcalophilus]
MKIFVHANGVRLTGKAWEIKAKLKEASQHYHYVKEWSETVYPPKPKLTLVDSATAKKKIGSS